MRKIGILGGTFNPIHNGHIAIAKYAMEEYHLDKVIFLTSGNPPHKRNEKILDAKIRHIMVKRAIGGISDFEACDWEVNRSEYSYTLNTLLHFKSIFPADEIYFIVGGDSIRDFNTWYKPEQILKLCTLLYYDRDNTLQCSFAKKIHGSSIDISSTDIRRAVSENRDINSLVPQIVAEFIKRNELYNIPQDFHEKLRSMLHPKRYIHSIGVSKTAEELACIHGADPEKARIAGLLHDNAKNMDNQLLRCEDLEAEIDDTERRNPHLLHAKLGSETAKCIFGITDSEIISAIRWHTIGKENMTLLEKIIFVADLVEPGRTFPDAKELREIAYQDLDRTLCECVKATISVNKQRNAEIHPNAYKILKEYENI